MNRVLLLIGLLGGVVLAAPFGAMAEGTTASAASPSSTLCGPFGNPGSSSAAAKAVASMAAPTVAATAASSSAPSSSEKGSILEMPTAPPVPAKATSADAESEALLALPKDAAGNIPTDFELGPEASIRESFFSPVICATVARVSGPAGASLEQLVTVVPEGSALVANDIYTMASSKIEPVGANGPALARPVAEPDPYTSLQYGLAISGLREAREISTGAGVTIALLDSAPEAEHRDLASGQIQPVAHDEGEEPPPVGVHGTLMAGVINAIEDNGFGIAGLAPGSRLVSIPVCRPTAGSGGVCTMYDLLRGFDQAWNREAKIVNLSLAGPPNILLERGVGRLEELGAVVVAAAGNEGTTQRRYPAAYPSVIGVGAVDREGRVFEASNRGDWVELAAPGVDVLSTIPGSAFAFGNGTSFAAAHVTGTLAVLTSVAVDPKVARGELFRAAGSRKGPAGRPMPRACDVLRRLGRECSAAD